jgi:hypothetical protein
MVVPVLTDHVTFPGMTVYLFGHDIAVYQAFSDMTVYLDVPNMTVLTSCS